MENKFLEWLSKSTASRWWHDSAVYEELKNSITMGAVGVTTNPLLIAKTIYADPDFWSPLLSDIPRDLVGEEKAEAILECVVIYLSKLLLPVYESTNGEMGFACAQVNPSLPGNAEMMFKQACKFSKWARNITVKLPATQAGIETLEECTAIGIPTTVTASFTVPQALAIGEGYNKGLRRAKQNGVKPPKCFAVLMIGRLDDYLWDVSQDGRYGLDKDVIIWSGIATAKRAYEIFKQNNYVPTILPAGMRGAYHMTELAGAELVFSTAPMIQQMVEKLEPPFEERFDIPVETKIINQLEIIPEFIKAYEPDGMKINEFITYGVTQKTLSQFIEAGWSLIENYPL